MVAHHALLAILQSIFDISTMRMMIDTYMAMMIDDGTYCDGDPLLAQASGKAIGIDNSFRF